MKFWLTLTKWMFVVLCLGCSVAAQEITVIRADRLIDGTGAVAVNDAVMVINEGRIVAVGKAGEVEIPQDAETIDMSGYTLLPGLMDCHVHLTGRPGDGGDTDRLR